MFFLKNVSILLFQYLHVHLHGAVVRCDALRQDALLQHLEVVSVYRVPVDVVDAVVGTVGWECIGGGIVQCGEVTAVSWSSGVSDWWVAQNT